MSFAVKPSAPSLKTDTVASEALCIRCGFCCDGTLFGHVPITDEEAASLPPPLEVVAPEGKRTRLAFLQPCAAFGVDCTVYEARPHTCRRYRCALLKDVEAGEVEFAAAAAIVERVQERCAAIATLTGRAFHHVKADLAANPAMNVDAILTLLAVERDLDRHFRRENAAEAASDETR